MADLSCPTECPQCECVSPCVCMLPRVCVYVCGMFSMQKWVGVSHNLCMLVGGSSSQGVPVCIFARVCSWYVFPRVWVFVCLCVCLQMCVAYFPCMCLCNCLGRGLLVGGCIICGVPWNVCVSVCVHGGGHSPWRLPVCAVYVCIYLHLSNRV